MSRSGTARPTAFAITRSIYPPKMHLHFYQLVADAVSHDKSELIIDLPNAERSDRVEELNRKQLDQNQLDKHFRFTANCRIFI